MNTEYITSDRNPNATSQVFLRSPDTYKWLGVSPASL